MYTSFINKNSLAVFSKKFDNHVGNNNSDKFIGGISFHSNKNHYDETIKIISKLIPTSVINDIIYSYTENIEVRIEIIFSERRKIKKINIYSYDNYFNGSNKFNKFNKLPKRVLDVSIQPTNNNNSNEPITINILSQLEDTIEFQLGYKFHILRIPKSIKSEDNIIKENFNIINLGSAYYKKNFLFSQKDKITEGWLSNKYYQKHGKKYIVSEIKNIEKFKKIVGVLNEINTNIIGYKKFINLIF